MINHFIGKLFGRAVGCPCHEDLFDFALDGLEAKQQQKVRNHLSDCPHCRDQVKDYAWVSEGIALSAPQIDPPVNMCDKVKERIRAEKAQGPGPGQGQTPVIKIGQDPLAGWPRFWMRMGPVFALSSLIMTGVAFMALYESAQPKAPAELAAAEKILNMPGVRQVSLSGEGESKSSKGSIFVAPGVDQVLVKVHGLKACSRNGTYALWAAVHGEKPTHLGNFKAENGRCSYLMSLSKPLAPAAKPLEFEVTQEEPELNPQAEKGPTRLRGRYNL